MKITDKVEVLTGSYKGRKGIVSGLSTQLTGMVRVKLYRKGTLPIMKVFDKQEPYFSKSQLKKI